MNVQAVSKITPKQERFCQEIVKGKSQADAYRAAYKPKKMTKKTIHEAASRLMAASKVLARVDEMMTPVIEKVQFTREQWIEDGLRLYRGDIRKVFDEFGNVDITKLGDSEADCIEGFEVTEDFTKVVKNDGTEDAVPTGYTKKIKFTSRKARHEYLGKALGYYSEKVEVKGVLTVEHILELVYKRDPTVIND